MVYGRGLGLLSDNKPFMSPICKPPRGGDGQRNPTRRDFGGLHHMRVFDVSINIAPAYSTGPKIRVHAGFLENLRSWLSVRQPVKFAIQYKEWYRSRNMRWARGPICRRPRRGAGNAGFLRLTAGFLLTTSIFSSFSSWAGFFIFPQPYGIMHKPPRGDAGFQLIVRPPRRGIRRQLRRCPLQTDTEQALCRRPMEDHIVTGFYILQMPVGSMHKRPRRGAG